MSERRKDIVERSRQFAIRIIKIAGRLPKTPAGFVTAEQLIGCGTSVGANTVEAQDASSKRDFINKMSISLRECRESKYWLSIIKEAGLLNGEDLDLIIVESDELCAIY